MNSREFLEKIFDSADVKINGNRPWDIKVYNDKFYNRIIAEGILGLGESYMDGWWDCQELDTMIYKVVSTGGERKLPKTLKTALHVLKSKIFNLQTKTRSRKVAEEHYNLGNDLYMAFLDPYNQYTCGYFKDTNDLGKAQENKLHLICRKLQLKPTDKVLDIGCGWGGFSKYASKNYGCHVTGISISDEQIKYAKEFTKGERVEILHMDYRDLKGVYDKVLICGMVEHVGYKNYRKIIEIVKNHLSSNGLFLLHTIGSSYSLTTNSPFASKYIFQNSMAPSIKQISSASDGLFVIEDVHNFGQYYDPTVMAWWKNFDKSWPKFKSQYSERFYKMFKFYLLSCAGLFRAKDLQLYQIVFSPNGVIGGYESIR